MSKGARVMKKYTVVGPHRVREISPGEVVDLDPENPGTKRLLQRGQIRPAAKKPVSQPDNTAATSADTEEE
jgi:hypothetical protein